MRVGCMHKRSLLGAPLLIALVVMGLLLGAFSFASVAQAADRWTDITDDQWVQIYGITAAEAASAADGYTDGRFGPFDPVTRGQFAKMAVDGFAIATANPVTPTFSDTPRNSTFYIWVEGGVRAGVISGYQDGTFRPFNTIARQQCNNILGSYLSGEEIDSRQGIQGSSGFYPSLAAWFAAEGEAQLSQFADGSSVLTVHRPGTAYLIMRGVLLGSVQGAVKYLSPANTLARAQAVAMIVRTRDVASSFAPIPVPTVTLLNPAQGTVDGGNQVVITGTNFVGVTSVTFGGNPVKA